ncbi:alpha/beta hydrolase [Parahaliea maris]|uniref:Alpha/beta hydrolase n=1 Tax=Parahaliea maris TaxID=2716870 RepID=A0A5C8ZU30_9GAMM|nr:alpha/beta hydrolase [Parahaliea maris]TXS92013.1 alpha/beta hydrolase [Parahaliea maris]
MRLPGPCTHLVALFFSLLVAGPFASAAETAGTEGAHPYLTIAELRERFEDAESRYLTVGDMQIHYKDEGPRDAPVLMMVHGSESSLRTWDVITDDLVDRYRIIRFDIPSYGLSNGASDSDVETIVPTDIPVALLDHLKVDRVTFVGVSSGGTMGMYLAARRPDMVERLIISNTPSDPVVTDHLVMPQSFIDATARARATGFQDEEFWNEFLSYFSGEADRISQQTRTEYYDFSRRTPEKHLIAMIARIGDGKQAKIEMKKVVAPTLLIWGTADPLLPEAAAVAVARYLENSQISRTLMPDVGHYPPLEVPHRFAQLIAAYVEAVVPNL